MSNRVGIDFGEWDKGFDLFSYMERLPKLLKKNGNVVIFNGWKNNCRRIKRILAYIMKNINEKTYNRVLNWITNKDVAFLSVWRNKVEDVYDIKRIDPQFKVGHIFSREQLELRHNTAMRYLRMLGYGVTKLGGMYPNRDDIGNITSLGKERSIMVVNLENDPQFKDNVLRLAEYNNQDSILYHPKDMVNNEGVPMGFLIGTNANSFPGYHKEGVPFPLANNISSPFGHTEVGNKTFSFTTEPEPPQGKSGFQGRKEDRIEGKYKPRDPNPTPWRKPDPLSMAYQTIDDLAEKMNVNLNLNIAFRPLAEDLCEGSFQSFYVKFMMMRNIMDGFKYEEMNERSRDLYRIFCEERDGVKWEQDPKTYRYICPDNCKL